MAFVHPQSCECTKSELDLFTVPPTQTSIESGSYTEYHPISSINDGTPIEFAVSGSGLEYLDLQNTQLYVRAQIVQADGTAIGNNAEVGPANLFLHSLFSEVDVKLNETLVTSTNNTYSYRAYLETLLSYGNDSKSSQLTSALYYKDTPGTMDATNPHAAAAAANHGLLKRYSFFNNGGVVDMVGRLHADLFFQDKYLPSEVNMRIRLVRNKATFCLVSSVNDAAFKVKIHDCKLYVRKVKLSPSVYIAHAKALEVGNAKYPIRRVICKTFTIPRGNLDWVHENLFHGQIPTRIVMACLDNDAFNGSYAKNCFNFKHYNMNHIKLLVDGQQHNLRPIKMNFAQNQYIMGYMSLFSATGKQYANEGIDIKRDEYKKGYTIFAFDLTSDQSPDDAHFSLMKSGSVRCEMNFAQPLPNTINVIAWAEFENVIEIDRNRNVIFDYAI